MVINKLRKRGREKGGGEKKKERGRGRGEREGGKQCEKIKDIFPKKILTNDNSALRLAGSKDVEDEGHGHVSISACDLRCHDISG